MGKNLNISIVLYNSDFEEVNNLVNLIRCNDFVYKIYLIDNSPLKNPLFEKCNAKYLFTGKNIGYGSGHNIAIQKSINDKVKYHLVLNSDISFNESVLSHLILKMDNDLDIGLIMPKIKNDDGSVQLLPKLLPTPFNLLIRVLKPLNFVFCTKNKRYTLEKYQDLELNVPIISGCFSFFRLDVLKDIGLYDENFFMYFEDFDLSRRIHAKYKTIYYPKVNVVHSYERGAAKNLKLFKIFVKSAILYFNKYGWIFDKERITINKKVIKSIK